MASISAATRAGQKGLLSNAIVLDNAPDSNAKWADLQRRIKRQRNVHGCVLSNDPKELILTVSDTLTAEEHLGVLTAVRDVLHRAGYFNTCVAVPNHAR